MSSKVLSSCVLRFMNLLNYNYARTTSHLRSYLLEGIRTQVLLKMFSKRTGPLRGSMTQGEVKWLSGNLSHPFPYLRNIFHGVVARSSVSGASRTNLHQTCKWALNRNSGCIRCYRLTFDSVEGVLLGEGEALPQLHSVLLSLDHR